MKLDTAAGVSEFDVADLVFGIIRAEGESTDLIFTETVAGDSSITPFTYSDFAL